MLGIVGLVKRRSKSPGLRPVEPVTLFHPSPKNGRIRRNSAGCKPLTPALQSTDVTELEDSRSGFSDHKAWPGQVWLCSPNVDTVHYVVQGKIVTTCKDMCSSCSLIFLITCTVRNSNIWKASLQALQARWRAYVSASYSYCQLASEASNQLKLYPWLLDWLKFYMQSII